MHPKTSHLLKLCIASNLFIASAGHAERGFQAQLVCGVGQPMIWNPEVTHEQPMINGFSLVAGHDKIEETPAGEAINLIEKGEWVKAIQTIESLGVQQTLVRDRDGMLRPLSRLKAELLWTMPEEGQRAFRKLNNVAAQNKLEHADTFESLTERAKAYTKLVSDYPLCDAAPRAAERLGDIRFEQGRFEQAAEMYRFAAERNTLASDDPMLMARRLIALARANRWQAFDDLATYANFRHPGTPVSIGGEEQRLPSLIEKLAESRRDIPATQTNASAGPLTVPSLNDRQFKRELIGKRVQTNLEAWASRYSISLAVKQLMKPIVTADDQRLFTLTLGSVARLNPETGTELWRIGDPDAHASQIQNRIGNLRNGYHPSLTLAGDTLIACIPSENSPELSDIHALSSEDGTTKWRWPINQSTQSHRAIGKPIVVGQTVYSVTKSLQDNQLQLIALAVDTGKQVGSLALGTAVINANAGSIDFAPRLAMGQNLLIVQTNNGAIIAIDPDNLSVAWAHEQQIRQPNYSELSLAKRHPGNVIARGGMVVAKDSRTHRVIAYQEQDARPLWSFEIDGDSTVAYMDDRHVYLLGEQLIALDKRTGEKVWWSPHIGKTMGQPVFTADACLIAGNRRLCRIDLATGRLTQRQDTFNQAADLTRLGNMIIFTGEDNISAYNMPAHTHKRQP